MYEFLHEDVVWAALISGGDCRSPSMLEFLLCSGVEGGNGTTTDTTLVLMSNPLDRFLDTGYKEDDDDDDDDDKGHDSCWRWLCEPRLGGGGLVRMDARQWPSGLALTFFWRSLNI